MVFSTFLIQFYSSVLVLAIDNLFWAFFKAHLAFKLEFAFSEKKKGLVETKECIEFHRVFKLKITKNRENANVVRK